MAPTLGLDALSHCKILELEKIKAKPVVFYNYIII